MTLRVVPPDIVDHLSDEMQVEWGWRRWGSCRATGVDRAQFYPGRGHSAGPAKAICETCPVRLACLTKALENRETEGVWGGTSEKDRRKLLLRIDAGESIESLVLPKPRCGCDCDECRAYGAAVLARRAAAGVA